MAIITDIKNLSQTAANNGPDGAVDPPASLDDQMRYLGAFIAQLRDQVGYTLPIFAPGMMSMFGGGTAPPGWLLCNGVAVSRTTYAPLFAAIGTAWGIGDNSTTFNLPDMRGLFPRGADNGRGTDPGRVLGSYQGHAYQSHAHGVNDPTHAHGIADPSHNHYVNDPTHAHSAWTDTQGNHAHLGGEFRGVNLIGGSSGAWVRLNDGSTRSWTDEGGNHAHNVGVGASGTGIWLNASGTGIGIYGNPTGISIQAAGAAGETRPSNNACNFIIHV